MSRHENNEMVLRALRNRRAGTDWWRTSCPFCEAEGHRDRRGNLGVHATSGFYNCFRCGTRGRLDGFESETLDLEPKEEKAISQYEPPEGFYELGRGDGETSISLKPARKYLRSRNVLKDTIRDLHIGACADGWWGGRIIVPFILSGYDQWLGWVGRLWVKKPRADAEGVHAMKYLYPKGMTRGTFLYNHDALYVETDEPLLIVEGAFDTFPFGSTGAAAVLGKPSHTQIEAMVHAKRPLCIVLDGDAWIESEMLALRLRFEGARAGWVKMPPGTDPDEVDREELMDKARRSIDAPM